MLREEWGNDAMKSSSNQYPLAQMMFAKDQNAFKSIGQDAYRQRYGVEKDQDVGFVYNLRNIRK